MEYQEYIDLGFERVDMNDSVEFKQTGYHGYSLSKDVNDRITICVSSGELDRPLMYISKGLEDAYHIITISPEAVRDIFKK